VVTVVLPYSAEMRLLREEALVLMGIDHVFLGEQLWYKLASGLPLLLEFFTTFWGSGVDAEDESVLLVSMEEGVQGLVGVVKMTTITEPSWVGDFVIEETGR